MTITIFENASVIDVEAGKLLADRHVAVEGATIKEVSERPVAATEARRIDLKGRTLMPGLIDAHVHVTAFSANFTELQRSSPFYVAAAAARIMGEMLDRGFTTVRDVGGAEFGLARAVEEGLIRGPRLIYGGKALSPTGGHGDTRLAGVDRHDDSYNQPGLGAIVDGVPEVRRRAREEVRRGAHHLKIMGNGGISSPTDRISSDQFSEEEIAAVVEEAEMANLYVAVHAYTARSIKRSVRLGVRSVEHGNLADEEAIALIKERNAFLVPTLATYRALKDEGVEAGLPKELAAKIDDVLDAGINAVEMAQRAGVQMAYGTDLLGAMHRRQTSEFVLRSDVVPAPDLVRAATVNGARLLRLENEIGQVKSGLRADLIVVEGNPLEDIQALARPEANLKLVMAKGAITSSAL
ncbi:imidazolonepropionase-like amidohydrolase [Mesorhizobium sp. J18]|uniref:metal-dependent hydrolase family protein n=1 Tax=Mesorhizobium sp. J18 TaxID=935263 RepID=UPI0011991B93|nr:amidohydrolase family protein [Mesorhizobium sp. J18]TWG98915.1 imidazolonepropionase-like amidohydrolase [Mesorhizobium sp. J18]